MASGLAIDRAAIHKKIWDARDRRGLVKIYQKQFAQHLGLSAPHMSRIIREMIDQGRIKKVGARYRNVGVYLVNDPADFPPPETKLRRTGVGPETQEALGKP